MSTMPTMYRKLAFNVVNDFEYLGIINDVPIDAHRQAQHGGQQLQGTVHLDQPRTRARSTWATPARALHRHLCGLMFQSALQMDMTPVPYKGTAPPLLT